MNSNTGKTNTNKTAANKTTTRKKKSLLRKFLTIVCSMVGIFLVVAVAGVYGFSKSNANHGYTVDEHGQIIRVASSAEAVSDTGNFFSPPKRTNVLVLGFHEEGFVSDVMMALSFNSATEKFDVITIPRDTYVTIPAEDVADLRLAGVTSAYLPNDGTSKINEVYNRVGSVLGKDIGREYSMLTVERLLGIKFDYYLEVDLEAFKEIIEIVDGIEMNLEYRINYNDPEKHPPSLLGIDLRPGTHILDARKAEAVIRYRSYVDGDLSRGRVQQEFLKAFLQKVTDRNLLLQNATSFVGTILTYVDTDFGLNDLPRYLKHVPALKIENVTFHTLPGEADWAVIGSNQHSSSVFFHDRMETHNMMQGILYGAFLDEKIEGNEDSDFGESLETTVYENVDLKSLKIQVLNGGFTPGFARRISDALTADGYNVTNIGDYSGTRKDETRIMTKSNIDATALQRYFSDSEIVSDRAVPDEYDIIVILGTKELLKNI